MSYLRRRSFSHSVVRTFLIPYFATILQFEQIFRDHLAVGFGDTPIAGLAQVAGAQGTRNSALHARSFGVRLAKLVRLLGLAYLLQGLMLRLGLEHQVLGSTSR